MFRHCVCLFYAGQNFRSLLRDMRVLLTQFLAGQGSPIDPRDNKQINWFFANKEINFSSDGGARATGLVDLQSSSPAIRETWQAGCLDLRSGQEGRKTQQ